MPAAFQSHHHPQKQKQKAAHPFPSSFPRLAALFQPTGPTGELYHTLLENVLKFEVLAAKIAIRRALVISQVSQSLFDAASG